jgi:hypothetical protein
MGHPRAASPVLTYPDGRQVLSVPKRFQLADLLRAEETLKIPADSTIKTTDPTTTRRRTSGMPRRRKRYYFRAGWDEMAVGFWTSP